MSERDLKGKILKLRYGLTTRLSEHGAGALYLAWDEDEERQVAVRIPHEDLLDDEEFLARFMDPAHVPTGIPNVVPVLEIGREKELPYAIVQHVEGRSLAERIEKEGGRLSPDEIHEWLAPVSDALEALHMQGGVHRSVSPRSILLAESGDVLLADLAVPSALLSAPTPPEALDPSVYMAPEALATGFTPKTDQYSLAAVVATAVMGEAFLTHQVRKGMIQALASRLPHEAAEALHRALDPEPDGRFPGVAEFTEAFTSAISATPLDMPLSEGTATMHLDDVKDQVATLIAEMEDGSDAPLAEPIAVAEPLMEPPAEEEEEAVVVVEPQEAAVGPTGEPPRRGRRWLLPVAAAVVLAAGAAAFFALSGGGGETRTHPRAERPKPVKERPPKPEEKPVEPPPFTARLEIARGDLPSLTKAASLEVTGRLLEAPKGWVTVGGERVEPDPDGSFRAAVELKEGTNELEIVAFDARGRSGEPERLTLVRDGTPPSLTVTAPRPDTFVGEATVRIAGRLVDDHPARVNVGDQAAPVDEGGAFSTSVLLPDEGPNRIELRGEDAAGNLGAPVTLTVIRDTLAPVLRIETPEDGALLADTLSVLRGRVEEANLVKLLVNGIETAVDDEGRFETKVTVGGEKAVLSVIAVDAAGHRTEATRTVLLDRSKPSLALDRPAGGLLTSDAQVVVSGRVVDDHAARAFVNGREVAVKGEDRSFEVVVPLREGRNEITVVGEDAAGNRSDPVTVTVTSDRTVPEVTLEKLPAESEEESVAVEGSVNEDGCAVTVGGKGVLLSGRTFRAVVPLEVGANSIEVVVRDAVGHATRRTLRITRVEPGPAPDVSRLVSAGARVNGKKPDRVPLGLSPGDRIEGPATVETPAGDRIVVASGSLLEVKAPESGVAVFFVVSGEVSGTITNRTSVGISVGWIVVPKGTSTRFTAKTLGHSEGEATLTEGKGALAYQTYTVLLRKGLGVRLAEEKAGDLRVFTGAENDAEVIVVNRAAPGLEVFARVPPGYSGEIRHTESGKRVRLIFETKKLSGKLPAVWCSVRGKRGSSVYVFPNKVCVVEKTGDSMGEVRLKDR